VFTYASLAFLFGIAAQFRAIGGYTFMRGIISEFESRLGIIYAVVFVTAVFSPFVLNDVVVLILTPVLIRYSKEFNVNVALLLVAEITFTNITSSLTPLGNPQNILLWQSSGISARQFVSGTWMPLTLSALIAVAALYPLGRKLGRFRGTPNSTGSLFPLIYLVSSAIVVFSSDLFGVPSYQALGISFLMGFLFTFRSLGRLPQEFDLKSLLILYLLLGSVTVTATFIEPAIAPYALQAASGIQPNSAVFMAVISSFISNVPATQLLLSIAHVSPHVAPQIAVEAGLAGNIDPVASLANILALLMARRTGLSIKRAVLLQFVIGAISFLPALL
jgi:Na+/H+ antiporter NhaD/arsenite permease-like protein